MASTGSASQSNQTDDSNLTSNESRSFRDAAAVSSLGFIILFLGVAYFFRSEIGSVVSGAGSAVGIPGSSVILGVPPFYVLELVIGTGVWFIGLGVIDFFTSVPFSWEDFTTELKQDVFFVLVLAGVFAASGILTGFGLRFSGYRGGEGLLFVGTIATLRDVIRWVNRRFIT